MFSIFGQRLDYSPCEFLRIGTLGLGGLSIKAAGLALAAIAFLTSGLEAVADEARATPLMRSAQSGPWSAPSTWKGGKLPAARSRVQVRPGHTVVYDPEFGPGDPFDPRRRRPPLRSRQGTRLDVG